MSDSPLDFRLSWFYEAQRIRCPRCSEALEDLVRVTEVWGSDKLNICFSHVDDRRLGCYIRFHRKTGVCDFRRGRSRGEEQTGVLHPLPPGDGRLRLHADAEEGAEEG